MEQEKLFTHILTPTDGSESSTHAGRLAIRLAALHHSRMTLMYVVDDVTVEDMARATAKDPETINGELEEKGHRYLDYLARIARNSGVQTEQTIQRGTPYWAITDLARERDVDLIVIGRVGCRGPRCALIGSVAERVLEYAECPVLVVSSPPMAGGISPRQRRP